MFHVDRLSEKYRNVSDDLKEKYIAENCGILFHANKNHKRYSLQKGNNVLNGNFTTLELNLEQNFTTGLKTVARRCRSSRLEVFLGKSVLKTCSKFTAEHPCQSVISIKFLFWHGCFLVNLLHIFRE